VNSRTLALLFMALIGFALPALCEEGIRPPLRADGSGIDPSFAGGWLSPEGTRNFAPYHWRDAVGFTPTTRAQWSYSFAPHTSLGLSMASGRDFDTAPIFGAETRQYGFIGRYSLASDWSLSAETMSREPNSLFRPLDFRIGLRRQF
jgi:hypothetical protein